MSLSFTILKRGDTSAFFMSCGYVNDLIQSFVSFVKDSSSYDIFISLGGMSSNAVDFDGLLFLSSGAYHMGSLLHKHGV